LTLILIVTVIGAVLGRWFYYRPMVVSVDSGFAVVDRMAAAKILAKYVRHPIDDSTYSWVILDSAALSDLLWLHGKPVARFSNSSFPQSTLFWPMNYANGGSYESSTVMFAPNLPVPVLETDAMTGQVGARRAGLRRQFLVDCIIEHAHGDAAAILGQKNANLPPHESKAHLYYLGPIPEGHLVFLAPLDDDLFSVVIFDVK
jgi:hypothetical protein